MFLSVTLSLVATDVLSHLNPFLQGFDFGLTQFDEADVPSGSPLAPSQLVDAKAENPPEVSLAEGKDGNKAPLELQRVLYR